MTEPMMPPAWLFPLSMSSAAVIAMRTWMLWPVAGRFTPWQQRESRRMVSEKMDAMRDAQMHAVGLAWRMTYAPWSVVGPLAGRDAQQASQAAVASMVRPFGRRAAGNAARLQARAVRTAVEAMPALAAWPAVPALPAPVASGRRPGTRAAGATGTSGRTASATPRRTRRAK